MTLKNMVTLEWIFPTLPTPPILKDSIRRAPKRSVSLSNDQKELAIRNALRYIPEKWHPVMAKEFLEELESRGRIYGYRFIPQEEIKGKPVSEYIGKCIEAKAIQVMIDNNLDHDVALYPYELITYGETGSVMQNWMQYHLIKKYLEVMNSEQTLVVFSGHPLGLFASSRKAPRAIMTNGLMIGMFDNLEYWNKAAALGVASYGQMTAGGWMYIGPQGIVHGTYSTLVNAGRKKLHIPMNKNLAGILFVSSGLGGMSGAQGKAMEIAGGVAIIAEVDYSRIQTRYTQGWIKHVTSIASEAFQLAEQAKSNALATSIAYHGNIVDLLEYAVSHRIKIELLSDQTSCHNAYEGGYCPVGLTFEKRTELLSENKEKFIAKVHESLKRHYDAITELIHHGTYFFDYGNSFMKAVYDAGVKEICMDPNDVSQGFIWPSYVQDIMGPCLFDYGYGPFRWVCLSGKEEDLDKTDKMAMECIDPSLRYQDYDNYHWIKEAKSNNLVVGTKARILYQDAQGRLKIALAFNQMVREHKIGPIMLGRDHHDTGGTDSPFRETSNILDGSNIMADMATSVFAGNAARGMTMVALHNGGGVGIGKSINGGFGMVLDGSKRVDAILKRAMLWDVMAGVARRAWALNPAAIETVKTFSKTNKESTITIPFESNKEEIAALVQKSTRLKGDNNHE